MCLSTGCGFCLSSLTLKQGIKIIFQTLYLWEKGSYILLQFDSGRGGEVGGQRYPKPPQTKNWEGQSPPRFEPKNTFTEPMYLTIPVTSATSQRTFSVLRQLKDYQRSTMKQSRQNRLNPQLPTDALSQIDYRHTEHCEDCSCQQTTQGAFWKIFVGVCVWLSRR